MRGASNAARLFPQAFGVNTVPKARQFDDLKATLFERAEQVCRHLYPAGRQEGLEWCVGAVNGEKGHSFKINLKRISGKSLMAALAGTT
jgi:hypothetical protein